MKRLIIILLFIFSFALGSSVVFAQSVTLDEVIEKMKLSDDYIGYINAGATIEFIHDSSNLQIIMSGNNDSETVTFKLSDNIISVASIDVISEKAVYNRNDLELFQRYEIWFYEIIFASGKLLEKSKADCQYFLTNGSNQLRELSIETDGVELIYKDYTFVLNQGDDPQVIRNFDQLKFDLDNPFAQGTPYTPSEPDAEPDANPIVEPDAEPDANPIVEPDAEPKQALPPNPNTGYQTPLYFICSGVLALTTINYFNRKNNKLFKI